MKKQHFHELAEFQFSGLLKFGQVKFSMKTDDIFPLRSNYDDWKRSSTRKLRKMSSIFDNLQISRTTNLDLGRQLLTASLVYIRAFMYWNWNSKSRFWWNIFIVDFLFSVNSFIINYIRIKLFSAKLPEYELDLHIKFFQL